MIKIYINGFLTIKNDDEKEIVGGLKVIMGDGCFEGEYEKGDFWDVYNIVEMIMMDLYEVGVEKNMYKEDGEYFKMKIVK